MPDVRWMSLNLFAAALCATAADRVSDGGVGPVPTLSDPETSLWPIINIAPAKGWPDGQAPDPAPGMRVAAFARNLDHPRWLHVLPNGDVLVAETSAPARPEDRAGIRGWLMHTLMKRAGAAVESANRITLLRDTDRDGVADLRTTFLDGLNSPFGMALVDGRLYVANTDSIVSVPYREGQDHSDVPPTKLVDLPGGPLNHHWTKSLIASPDATRLYVGVGSNSNVAEHGIDKEAGRAAIWEIDIATGRQRICADGLRNPVGMAWEPSSGLLWVAVNERDELGDDLVPDYMTSIRCGDFYGWPYSYFGAHVDERAQPQRPDLVAAARVPDYALGAHTASLGLTWFEGHTLPYPRGMFVGQHGSWNRSRLAGYKVIFVRFDNGRPAGEPVDVLTGFVNDDGDAYGRPAGVAVDDHGALLVADDVGNTIWRVSAIKP